MRAPRADFRIESLGDVHEEVRLPRVQEQQVLRVVRADAGVSEFGQEVVVPRVDHRLERGVADGLVVGVLVVGAPGVVGENGVGLQVADQEGDLVPERARVLEFPVAVAEEQGLLDAQDAGGFELFRLADPGEVEGGDVVFRALVPVRADDRAHGGAIPCPAGDAASRG